MKNPKLIQERIHNLRLREKDGLEFTEEIHALEYSLLHSEEVIKNKLQEVTKEARFDWARILIWVIE